MMGKTFRKNSDDTPRNHRRERRRKLKTMNKEFTSSRYNNAEDYQDLSYLDEYSSYQRFDQRKHGRK